MTIELDILIKARELISTPEKWTQEVLALDRYGCAHDTVMNDFNLVTEASCYCGEGAVMVANALLNGNWDTPRRVMGFLTLVMNQRLYRYNDTHTHEEILNKFDEAIKFVKLKEAQE